MKNKIFIMIIMMAVILAGCTKEPENNYLNNLKVSYTLKSNNEKVSQEDFEFYYGYAIHEYLNKMGDLLQGDAGNVLPFEINNDINSLSEQDCTIDGYTDHSWEYYFASQAKERYHEIESLYKQAKDNHFEVTDEITKLAKEDYQRLVKYCQDNKIAEEDYLHSMFGIHATQESIIKQYEKLEIVTKYTDSFYKDITNQDIEKYYQEHQDDFDTVNIRYFAFPKNKEGKQQAEAFQKSIKDEHDFKKQAIKYAQDTQKVYYKNKDLSLRENLRKEDLPEYLKDVLFSRKMDKNEVKVIEGDNSYDVVMFIKRQKPIYHQVNISTIYLDARDSDNDKLTQEKLDVCHKFALELLDELKTKTDGSLDSFHEYNQLFSDNKTNQGDYFGISKRDSSLEIEKWIFDQHRKYGDMAVLPSTYGYTIVYYKGVGEVEYLVRAEEALLKEVYASKVEEAKSTMKVEID